MSAVLGAIGLTQEEAMGTLRLSTGRYTTKEDVERALEKHKCNMGKRYVEVFESEVK